MKIDPYFIQYTKMNSKWIKDLNVRPKTMKLLEQKRKKTFHDNGLAIIFLDTNLKDQPIESKN